MMRASRALVIWILVAWPISQVAAAEPEQNTLQHRLERMARAEAARIRGDLSGLEAIRVELEAAFKQPNEVPADLHYDTAYVLWRCLQNLNDVEEWSETQKKYPEQARAHVDALLALRPDSLEAKILDGAITGVEADLSMFGRMRLGRISHTITRANAERAPNNPRTRLQWGIVLLYTPALFGGGSEPAIEQLEVAHANFEMQHAEKKWPNWGAHETQAWLGMALARAGRLDEARSTYQRVLEREPGFAWVRTKLLPALDR